MWATYEFTITGLHFRYNTQVCTVAIKLAILDVQRCFFAGCKLAKTLILHGKKGVAKMILQDKAFLERLRTLKDKSGLTTKQIAEKCDTPESTVARIFSGKTPNPTIITVLAMVKAMGGTAADIFDDNAQVNTNPMVPQVVVSDIERAHSETTELYKDIIKSKDKSIRLLTYVLLAVGSVIVFLLLFDLFNGGIGYFRG